VVKKFTTKQGGEKGTAQKQKHNSPQHAVTAFEKKAQAVGDSKLRQDDDGLRYGT
jgi:hypothetical protein